MNTKLVVRGLLAAVSAAIVLSGCPNPITDQTFLQMADRNPPTVDIASPAGGTPYTQTVTVQGTAIDGEGRLKGIAWTVTGALGVLEEGTIPASGIGPDDDFSFPFSTLTYSGPIAVTVEATDWNDNVGEATVTLVEPDGQLSSFTVTPDNKRVSLDWDEVDGATYTIYYTTNGTIPTTSDRSVSPSAPPCVLGGLQNGDLHTFLLRAHLASGTDYWSGYVKAIPLSEMTLAPQVTGAYQKIALAWNAIEATDEFVVQRSLTPDDPGSWTDYTGIIVGTDFTDNAVSDGTWYYYRVRPAFAGSVTSVANGGQTFRLPPYISGSIISLDTPGTPVRLKAKGTKVFIAAGTAGLVVVDVAEPYAPRVIATYPTTNAKDIELDTNGDYAFIADGTGGLVVLDVSDPFNPTLANSIWWTGVDATAVAVIDAATDYVYVLGVEPLSVTRIRTVDVTTRTAIVDQTAATYTNAADDFTDVAATVYSGTRYLFLTAGLGDGLLKVQHTATQSLVPVGIVFTDADYFSNFAAVKPTTTGTDCLYVLGQAKFYLEPPPPYVLMAVRISDLVKQGESAYERGYVADVNLDLLGTTAYAADGIRLVSYDLSTPTTPVVGESWNIPGAPTGAASNGPYVFAAAGALGFHLVNAGLPFPPTIIGASGDALAGFGIAVRGNTVFMSVGAPSTPGIQAYDVSDPEGPVTLGFTPLAGPGKLVISGDYLFVANGSSLKVLDITDPALPLPEVGTADSRYGSMSSIAVSGDLAFLTGSAFQCFDVADPTNPIYRGIHDSDGGGVNGVAGRGRMAYVAEGAYFQPNSLKLLDLSNPSIPVLVGEGATGGMTVESVVLDGPWAFVTDSFPDQGLWAVNIDPASPSYLATYGPCDVVPGAGGEWADAVFSYGGWAYVTFDSVSAHGLSVIDVANPTALDPASAKHALPLGGKPRGLTISGRYGYVANGSLGLQVIQVAP